MNLKVNFTPLRRSIGDGWRTLTGRWIYFVLMIVIPLGGTFFFLDLMNSGLPTPVPVAVVDQDHSSMSRQLIRTLGTSQITTITVESETFHDAVRKVRSGEVMGFFLIPRNFQREAMNGGQPTLSYFCNLTYYVPGSLAFKGFKTVAVSTTGGIVSAKLIGVGMNQSSVGSLIQPIAINQNPIGNPWMNYNYYLSVSFIAGLIALLVMQTTAASIAYEFKRGTSPLWIQRAGGSVLVAVVGKLLPQTIVWSVVGVAVEAILFKFVHFPLNNHAMHMIVAMVLMVIGCQGFALTLTWIVPNLRLSVTLCSLVGILSFSIAAFSFPVDAMYPAVGIFSYILPVRYFFLIYGDQALSGFPLYYSRIYYAALLIFPLVGLAGISRIKRHALNPVYVP